MRWIYSLLSDFQFARRRLGGTWYRVTETTQWGTSDFWEQGKLPASEEQFWFYRVTKVEDYTRAGDKETPHDAERPEGAKARAHSSGA